MRTSLFHRCSVSIAALALLAGATPSLAAPDWDIVGIRLGMSPAQARAAIAAHAPKAQITDYIRQFAYSDGVAEKPLPDFLSAINASQGPANKSETLEVMFSAPPMEQRVIRVIRTLRLYDDPLPMERAMASVTQKYGKTPKVREAADSKGNNFLRWDEPGKTVCGDTRPNSWDAWQVPHVDNTPNGFSSYGALQRRKQAPADAANCSAALVVNLVTLPGNPSNNAFVREMKFTMTDPGYAIPAMRATAKQIADLEAQARKARQNSGTAPKL